MKKRGIAPIIITVVSIVLVLSATTIIWNSVTDNLDTEQGSPPHCLSVSLQPFYCSYTDEGTVVRVRRAAGVGDLTGIRFIFEQTDDTITRDATTDPPLELESKTYYFPTVYSPVSFDLAPIINARVCAPGGSPYPCTEVDTLPILPQCGDGLDNDGDGDIDFPADLGCSDINDDNEIDELGQTFACSDGVDNDGDGDIDFPADPECTSPQDDSEGGSIIFLGCENGIDDDDDGWEDINDPDCSLGGTANGREEWVALTECQDEIDNDKDGAIDNEDSQCQSGNDLSERDTSSGAACENGVDDDGDGLIDQGIDPGCSDWSDNSESGESTSHNFAFYVSPATTQFVKLNWTDTSSGSVNKVVSWTGNPNSEFLLHSSRSHSGQDYTFKYSLDGSAYITVLHDDLTYTFISQTSDGFSFSVRPRDGLSQAFVVNDQVTFRGNTMYVRMEVTNTDANARFMRIPIFFSGLSMGNQSARQSDHVPSLVNVLLPRSGDIVLHNFSSDAQPSLFYPRNIGVVSPFMAYWDANFTIGMQSLSPLSGRDEYALRPIIYTGSTQKPAMLSYIDTYLPSGESRVFTIAYTLAPSGEWEESLQTYKTWFDAQYGDTPDYCPDRAFSYRVGYNSNYYDTVTDHYRPGTNLSNIFLGDPAFMQQRGIAHAGMWATAIHTKHITSPSSCPDDVCEYSPMIDLINPYITAGPNPGKIDEFVNSYNNAGVGVFFFARPCDTVYGANITYDILGNPTIIPGQHAGLQGISLLNVTHRDRYLKRMQFLTDHGAEGFYFDAIGCQGSESFISYAREQLDPNLFIAMEGFRDRTSLLWNQIPFPKRAGTYDPNYDLLIDFISPLSTYYGGSFNTVLDETGGEIEDFVDKGGQVVLGSQSFTLANFQSDVARGRRFCDYLETSYQNQLERWNAYGSSQGCARPQAPQSCPV